jgi:hypothetical protein
VQGFLGWEIDEPCFESRLLRVGVRSVIVGVAWSEMCVVANQLYILSINIQRHCAGGLSCTPYLVVPRDGTMNISNHVNGLWHLHLLLFIMQLIKLQVELYSHEINPSF